MTVRDWKEVALVTRSSSGIGVAALKFDEMGVPPLQKVSPWDRHWTSRRSRRVGRSDQGNECFHGSESHALGFGNVNSST